MGLVIRAYRQADRHAVRAIACETAVRGEAVERFFHDREVFAAWPVTGRLSLRPEAGTP